jgi:hypothetical protein
VTFEVASFPGYSRTELFTLVVSSYLTDAELHQAREQLTSGVSYEEVVSALANLAQNEMRRTPCCITIPGGHVLAFPPDRPQDDLSYMSFQLMEVVQAALPPPADVATEPAPLTLWGQPVVPKRKEKVPSRQRMKTRSSPGRVHFEFAQQGFRHDEEGWIAIAHGETLGLGYRVEPLSKNDGYWIDLLHLRSSFPLAHVIMRTSTVDHKRIQEWVLACLPLCDWTQAYQTLLRRQPEQKGLLKRQVLSQRLENIWQEQEKLIRQRTLFDPQDTRTDEM